MHLIRFDKDRMSVEEARWFLDLPDKVRRQQFSREEQISMTARSRMALERHSSDKADDTLRFRQRLNQHKIAAHNAAANCAQAADVPVGFGHSFQSTPRSSGAASSATIGANTISCPDGSGMIYPSNVTNPTPYIPIPERLPRRRSPKGLHGLTPLPLPPPTLLPAIHEPSPDTVQHWSMSFRLSHPFDDCEQLFPSTPKAAPLSSAAALEAEIDAGNNRDVHPGELSQFDHFWEDHRTPNRATSTGSLPRSGRISHLRLASSIYIGPDEHIVGPEYPDLVDDNDALTRQRRTTHTTLTQFSFDSEDDDRSNFADEESLSTTGNTTLDVMHDLGPGGGQVPFENDQNLGSEADSVNTVEASSLRSSADLYHCAISAFSSDAGDETRSANSPEPPQPVTPDTIPDDFKTRASFDSADRVKEGSFDSGVVLPMQSSPIRPQTATRLSSSSSIPLTTPIRAKHHRPEDEIYSFQRHLNSGVDVDQQDALALQELSVCDDPSGASGAFAVHEDGGSPKGLKRVFKTIARH